MAERKKILHLITGLELGGGAENMLLQLLLKMRGELDNRVCAIKGRGEIGKKLEDSGMPVYYLELKSIFDFGIIFRYRKVLKDFNPDVQVNYLIHADIFGRVFGKIFRVKKIVPYIRNIHRNRRFLMLLDKITLLLAYFVLTNSETAKKYYIEKMGVRADKIKCIPNAVDISRFENVKVTREEKLKELGIPENKFIIGCVARLEKQKDISTLIKAFALVHKKNPETHLIIVGHGKEKGNLINLAKNLRLVENILFLEKRKDMPEIYKALDLFVLPSLNEGMSNAILEAMVMRKVIITSDIEENKELIENGKDGLNFEKGKYKNLADTIMKILENRSIFEEFSKNAYRKVSEKYNAWLITREFEEFLLKL